MVGIEVGFEDKPLGRISEGSRVTLSNANSIPTRRFLGRYALFDEIASGGMASVHLGRMHGPIGFARTVAIKCLHPHYAKDPEFVSMFLDEARLASRILHPNVVSTLDIVAEGGELFLVMEYIPGDSLAHIVRNSEHSRLPPAIAVGIVMGALHGLHAAHEARSEKGLPLCIVHRDISPQNILVGTDGVARVLDFGIAKAVSRLQTTRDGQLKGKLAYMAPEQLDGDTVDRRADIYAAGVVLWEILTGKRLFSGKDGSTIINTSQRTSIVPPSHAADGISPAVDAIVLKALAVRPDDRFSSAREMAVALEETGQFATQREVGECVERSARASLRSRSEVLAGWERHGEWDERTADAPVSEGGQEITVLHGVGAPLGKKRRGLWGPRSRSTKVALGTLGVLASVVLLWGGRRSFRHPFGAAMAEPIVLYPARAAFPGVDEKEVRHQEADAEERRGSESSEGEAAPTSPAVVPEPGSPVSSRDPSLRTASRKVGADGVKSSGTGREATTKESCDPPYTIDDEGIRIPKRFCL